MSEYKHVVYSSGYTLEVDPPDRCADVMHYLITGELLGGRSLGDVTWEKIENNTKRDEDLARSLKYTHESI